MASYALAATATPHSVSAPGIAFAVAPPAGHALSAASLVLTGGADKCGIVYSTASARVCGRLEGAGKALRDGAWVPGGGEALLTGSADGAVRLWTPPSAAASAGAPPGAAVFNYAAARTLRPLGAREDVSGVAAHPLGRYAAVGYSGSAGGGRGRSAAPPAPAVWCFADLETGRVLSTVEVGGGAGGGSGSSSSSSASSSGSGSAAAQCLAPLRFHPDGMLLATFATDGLVRLYDVRSSSVALAWSPPASAGGGAAPLGTCGIAFSESGVHFASGYGSSVCLRDLRKASGEGSDAIVSEWGAGSGSGGAATCLAFDDAGKYLAAGRSDGSCSVYAVGGAGEGAGGGGGGSQALLATPRHHTGSVSGVCWGPQAEALVSVGATDRQLCVYKAAGAGKA